MSTMLEPKVFLDTSALFAAIWSPQGGGRALLRLGEAQVVDLAVSSQMLTELDRTVRRKSAFNLADVAQILDVAGLKVVGHPPQDLIQRCVALIGYENDARVLAAAWHAEIDFFATLDRRHFLSNQALTQALPFPLGTPGDCLAWLRDRLVDNRGT